MRKRLVYRADDVGYTHAFNDGTFKAIDEGIVTSVDVMFDTPGTIEALEKLKEYPWLSIGWHRHLWGKPVLPAEEVPSMVNDEGRFKWRKDQSLQNTVTYEDAYKEFDAQMQLCLSILGRVPDTASVRSTMPIDRAFKDICDKYGIVYNYWGASTYGGYISSVECPKKFPNVKYNPRGMRTSKTDSRFNGTPNSVYYDLANFKDYDPESLIMDVDWSSDDEVRQVGGHPGYLDDYIIAESSCTIHRVKELEACISPRVKQWIIDNEIELVNQRDALYGTNEFQNHLMNINSPLWIGNIKNKEKN